MTASARVCEFCESVLGFEPSYPIRFGDMDADLRVCIECASYLAQQGVGAWQESGQVLGPKAISLDISRDQP